MESVIASCSILKFILKANMHPEVKHLSNPSLHMKPVIVALRLYSLLQCCFFDNKLKSRRLPFLHFKADTVKKIQGEGRLKILSKPASRYSESGKMAKIKEEW